MYFVVFLLFVHVNCQLTRLETNSPPGARNAAMWCSNDQQYVFGGKTLAGRTNSLWVYSSGQWTQLDDAPDSLSGVIHWTRGNELWMYGGRTTTIITDKLYKYSNSWSTITTNGPGPGPRYGSIFWYLDSTLYLYGGRSDNHTVQQDMWSLDRNNNWSLISTDKGPGPIDDGKAAVDHSTNNVYVYGGENQQDQIQDNILWMYNNAVGWTSMQIPLNDGREDHLMWISGRTLFIVSGKDETGNIDSDWQYSIESDSWSESDLGLDRWGAAMCQTTDDSVYVHGGRRNGVQLLNDVWTSAKVQPQTTQLADVMSTLTFVLVLVLGIAFAANKYRINKL